MDRYIIRDLKLNDLVILENNNKIPNLFNGPYKLIRTIEQNNEVIGAFWARVTVEPTLILKEDLSHLQIARTLDETFKYLYCKIPEELGISDCFIVFENKFDAKYIQFLNKHYNIEELSKVLRLRRNDA